MLTFDNAHNYPLTITPKHGDKPARVDGVPTWSIDNESCATLEVAEDGMSAKVITADTGADIRSATITITADADLGDGVQKITATVPIVVGPEMADTLGIGVGEPEAKEAASS